MRNHQILAKNEKRNHLLIVVAVVMLILVVKNQAIVQPAHLYFKVHCEIQAGRMIQVSYREFMMLLIIETKIF